MDLRTPDPQETPRRRPDAPARPRLSGCRPGSMEEAISRLVIEERLPAEEAARRLGLPVTLIDGPYGPAVVIGQLSAKQVEWAHEYIVATLRERQPEWFGEEEEPADEARAA